MVDLEDDLSKKDNDQDKEKEELDMIDEDSLKELFQIKDKNDPKEENMYIQSLKENKPKKKKKKKKIKKEKLASLQEEITSKLLDIDTLREVLDGMEIRIKFYNKNKK